MPPFIPPLFFHCFGSCVVLSFVPSLVHLFVCIVGDFFLFFRACVFLSFFLSFLSSFLYFVRPSLYLSFFRPSVRPSVLSFFLSLWIPVINVKTVVVGLLPQRCLQLDLRALGFKPFEPVGLVGVEHPIEPRDDFTSSVSVFFFIFPICFFDILCYDL